MRERARRKIECASLRVVVLDPLGGGLGEDELVGPEHVGDGDLVLFAELEVGEVGGGALEDLVGLVDDEDDLLVGVDGEALEHLDDGGGLGGRLHLADDLLDDERARGAVLDRDGDGELGLLAVHLGVGPVLGLGSEDDAASDEERRVGRALARATGALLLERLATACESGEELETKL